MAHDDFEKKRRRIFSDASKVEGFMERQNKRRARLDALLAPEEDDGFSFGDAGKKALGLGLSGLDYLGSLTRHGIREIAETTGLRENTEGLTAGDILRSTDEADATVQNMRATLGIDPNAGGRWAGALDTFGMIATDPLSGLTLGTGAAARGTLSALARTAGDDVAEAVARGGIRAGDDLLAQRAATVVPAPANELLGQITGRAAPRAFLQEAGGPASVREVLQGAADTGLSRRNLDDVVDRQLTNLGRRGRGGVGFLGFQTGIGAGLGGRAAAGAQEALLPLTRLLSPTADVASQLGRPAAEAVDAAIHTGGNVRRAARERLADGIASADEVNVVAQAEAKQAMADDLAQLGGARLAADEALPGFVEFGGRFVPKPVADALNGSIRTPSGRLLQAVDKGTSVLKRFTTLGPLNAVPHVARNIMSNKLFASMFGGVHGPEYYLEARGLRKALMKVDEPTRAAGGRPLEDALRAQGLDEMKVRRALATHDQQLAGRGGSAFDDVDVDGARAQGKGLRGTRTAARVNQYDEELTRGAVFLKALDDGLEPRLAAQKSRHALLDYTDEGLTPFERNVLQRVVFFYKFPRRAIPTGLEFMARYPGASLALSEAGVGVAQGTRNEYNEKIGAYLDTPLEATVGGVAELLSEPTGAVNPVLRSLATGLAGEDVELGKALPPLGQAQRFIERQGEGEGLFDREGGISPSGAGPFGAYSIFGVREGKDYGRERWLEDMEGRVAEKGEPSKTDRLILAALDAGIEQPYEMSDSELAKALVARGVQRSALSKLVEGK